MVDNEQARDMEQALAGAILIDSKCLALLPEDLKASDIRSAPCRAVFLAAKALNEAGNAVDYALIRKWCRDRGYDLPAQTVNELMEITPSAASAGSYGKIVHENALRRQMDSAMIAAADDRGSPLPELVQQTVEKLEHIGSQMNQQLLITASEVPFETPKWLIEPYIQRGKGTLIQADPGTGKTAFACALAAAVSTGRGFLNLRVDAPGDVVMISTEDDLGVLRGRIEADGGDLTRIHFLADPSRLILSSPKIRRAIRACRAKLIIFDPFQAFLGSNVDLFRANETRPILAKLFAMCAEEDCACIIIAHLGKVTQGKSAVNQSLGSVDIPGAMRSILHIVRNPRNTKELLALHIKSSNAAPGKTIAYTIGERGRVDFTGFSDMTLADIAAAKEAEVPFEQDPIVEVLAALMAKKGDAFYSYETIRDTACKQLGYFPFRSSKDLRRHLELPDFLKQLQEKEGIRLTTGQHQGGIRGIRMAHYRHPEGYQTAMEACAEPCVPDFTGYYPAVYGEGLTRDA